MSETKEKKDVIHSSMTIEEILNSFPSKAQRIAQELTNSGLHCVGCGAATWETLEAGVLTHGMPPSKVEELVRSLNAILDEEDDLTAVTFTARAAKKFIEILDEEKKQGWSLRFGEKMAGCSGFEYLLDFSEKPGEEDTIFESEGIEIHVETRLVSRLVGCTIDYIDGLQNSGFKVSNPNVKAACGCGTSHGY
jgi:iron-sulfur cluster assembly protein